MGTKNHFFIFFSISRSLFTSHVLPVLSCVSLIFSDKLKLMKKTIILILFIILSSFFLISPKWVLSAQINNGGKAVLTTELSELAPQINKIVNYSTGIGGAIAFILIVIGGFQIIFSSGNPERVKAGKEMITSAIAGLLLIIFAVFILRLIGYDILRIPGFEK